MNKLFHSLAVCIVFLAIITSCFGLFYSTEGESHDFVNQYGDIVNIYGDGIYRNDSLFMAPIFRGTDCTLLFLGIPLLIIALILDIRKNSIRTKLFLTTFIALFLYYSASLSFGVVYNVLHLVYIALFGCSFFATIIGFSLLKKYKIESSIKICTTLKFFLIICGLSLFVAWLPDIIWSLVNKRSLALIEIYTTQITYILDMGIISPLIFICLYYLIKREQIGIILLGIILNMVLFVGIMVIVQALFQIKSGIDLPIQAIITKVGIFVVLAITAVFYEVRLFRNIKEA
jgi:hypothetical protein